MHLNRAIDGTGKPLLLMHGFTGIGRGWRYLFGKTPMGFQHVMPDLSGHGAWPDYDQFSFRGAAMQILADFWTRRDIFPI